MLRGMVLFWVAAIVAALATATEAQAWGCRHVGYTHVGPSGVYHYGHTSAYGPYGGYSGSHYGAHYGGGYDRSGAYGAAYHSGAYGGYHYTSSAYGGGYHYGGYATAADPYAYHAGVYRAY
jgi:hypothetical protein